jgi:large subunit ribosomal protein L19
MNEIDINPIKEKKISKNLIKIIEKKYFQEKALFFNNKEKVAVGDSIRLGYLIPEGDKERTQYYEGLIIAINNRDLGKSFTLRRTVQGIGIEQIFLAHSPQIISIIKKQSSKIRRAKLYFIRNLRGKSTRLKPKL